MMLAWIAVFGTLYGEMVVRTKAPELHEAVRRVLDTALPLDDDGRHDSR